jgi:hypothetical protein
MNKICTQIATEKDPETFDKLVKELSDLLEQKHERIHPTTNPIRPRLFVGSALG